MAVDEDLGAYERHFESQAKRQGIDPKDWSLLRTDKMSGHLKIFLVETGLNLHNDFEDCHSNSSSGFTWRNRSDKRAVVEYGNNKRPYWCYKCNEQGHIAKECSMYLDTGACYSCRKPAHIQRNCPNGTSRASNWRTENVHRRLDDLKCYCCGGFGLISRACPTAQRDMLGIFSLLKDSHMRVR
ncbi:DNA-binding protein HEXBP-like [Physella acuta]|uniref:DNA-binding protein HEXBP-like n=1 Tax=Physella acuta TaxID=109671 RepID=UPI0027DE3D5F|nr:DNA-binding protein HEXBP-like [Physella acuta]